MEDVKAYLRRTLGNAFRHATSDNGGDSLSQRGSIVKDVIVFPQKKYQI